MLIEAVRAPDKRRTDLSDLLQNAYPGELERLVTLASYHRVPGVVYRAVSSSGVAGGPVSKLRAHYHSAVASHLRLRAALSSLATALEGTPEPWVVVKGPVLAELAYRETGLRHYSDLDLLTSRRGFAQILERVESSGGRSMDCNWPLLRQLRHGEITVRLPEGAMCDLHWHLVYYPTTRARFSLRIDELLGRAVPEVLGTVPTVVLDPTDQLLHLCLHGALSGGHQLVWLKDIERAVENRPPDWDALVARARRYRLGLVCAVMLQRSQMVVGASVPPGILASLAPDQLVLRWWATRQRAWGDAPWGRTTHTGRTLMASTGANSMATLATLAGTVGSLSWERAQDQVAAWQGKPPPERRPALFKPVGGPEERQAYLGAVAAEAG